MSRQQGIDEVESYKNDGSDDYSFLAGWVGNR